MTRVFRPFFLGGAFFAGGSSFVSAASLGLIGLGPPPKNDRISAGMLFVPAYVVGHQPRYFKPTMVVVKFWTAVCDVMDLHERENAKAVTLRQPQLSPQVGLSLSRYLAPAPTPKSQGTTPTCRLHG